MKKILQLRNSIDEIDEQIILFLRNRIGLSKRIGRIKKEQQIPIRDHDREDQVYRNIMKRATQLGLNPHDIRTIYHEIVAMSTRAQEET